MATSTRDDIIKKSLIFLGVIRLGSSLSTTQINNAVPILDSIAKSWQSYFIESWPQEEAVLFLSSNKTRYTLGADTTICALNPARVDMTFVSSNIIDVGNTDEYIVGQNIGIIGHNGRLITTISSIINSTQLGITDSLDNSIQPILAFIYDSTISDIVRIVSAFDTLTENPVNIAGRKEYGELVHPAITGNIITDINLYRGKDKQIIRVWLPPTHNGVTVSLNVIRPLDLFTDGSTPIDMPEEWELAFALQLAVLMADTCGKDMSISKLPGEAQLALNIARMASNTNGSAFLCPNSNDED